MTRRKVNITLFYPDLTSEEVSNDMNTTPFYPDLTSEEVYNDTSEGAVGCGVTERV